MTVRCVSGGVNIKDQAMDLQYGVDILTGTSRRILELVKIHALNLREVRYLLMDDADELLQGCAKEVETILEMFPSKPQVLMFSSTFPKTVSSWITKNYVNKPTILNLVSIQ